MPRKQSETVPPLSIHQNYFDQWAPVTAQDMLNRIPVQSGESSFGSVRSSLGGSPGFGGGNPSAGGRGLGSGSGQAEILIDGNRTAGKNKTFIATLVERHTRYVMLAKVEDKRTDTVISALIKQAHRLPSELYKSLTWNRGSEMTDHQRFTLETDIKVYFCDSQNPWQRGIDRKHIWTAEILLPKRN